jgi:hypothetical protein
MRHRAVLLAATLPLVLACVSRDDDYLLLRREAPRNHGAATPLRFAEPSDQEALRVRRLLADGFGAELLLTHAMTKRFAARTTKTAATEAPTMVALGTSDVHREQCRDVGYRDRVLKTSWLAQRIPADAPLVWADSDPWPALVRGLGGAIVDLIAPGGNLGVGEGDRQAALCHPLRDGYVAFLNVVAAEWRDPTHDPDHDHARAEARASTDFAAVRGNTVRPGTANDVARDPTVIATVLYRIASSELGRRMVADDVYTPFFESRPPRGIPPGMLLGAFRNFQAKLIWAWSRAVSGGRPPANLVDLVEAYADAYPAERNEVTRIFLVTTWGATVVPGGVARDAELATASAQLAMLTADVLFGRFGLRDAMKI